MSALDARRGVFLVTGAQAAGKSTVGRLLAERFDRGAFVEGDLMWKLVVSGAEVMTPEPSEEALRQYELRLRHGAMLADSLYEAGFTAVHADVVIGEQLAAYPGWVRHRPLYVVMLSPSPEAVLARERGRGSNAYRDWPSVEQGVADLCGAAERSPRLGLWVDSSGQTPGQTVDEILQRVWDTAVG